MEYVVIIGGEMSMVMKTAGIGAMKKKHRKLTRQRRGIH